MKMKKLLSGAMAAALSLSLAVPAFALEVNSIDGLGESSQVEITGETNLPTIKISVPDNGKVVLNPYKLDYVIDETTTKDDQIISTPQFVVNESSLGLKVSASVLGTAGGSVTFASSSLASDTTTTDKKVYLTVEMQATTDGTTEPTWAPANEKALSADTPVEYKKTDSGDTRISLVAGSASTGNKALAYRFNGDAISAPAQAWTADDTVGAMITFTFELVANS